MEEIVRLRGHHILCLLGFRGLGYSPEFAENMTRVYSRVFSHDSVIEIAAGQDDICGECPKRDGRRCRPSHPSSVNLKDSAVLELLSLRPGDRLASEELYRRVAEHVTPEDHSRICRRCKWASLGYCAEGLNRLIAERSGGRNG